MRGRLVAGLAIALGCGDESGGSDPFGGDPFPGPPMGDSGDDDGDDGESGDDGAASDDAMLDDGDDGSTGAPEDPATYDDIAVIPMPEGWMAHADGTWSYPLSDDPSASPFFALAQEFYAQHPDEYDFISVYTEGLLFQDFWALAVWTDDDLRGIGFDGYGDWLDPSWAGSAGRLAQINVMNAAWQYAPNPTDADVLVHEVTHRWAAYIEVPGTPAAGWLLDDSWSHWNVHVSTGGPSAMGYGGLTDLGNGRFQFDEVYPLALSPLELYLAGFIPASEVPPMFYVTGATDYDPAVSQYTGAPFTQGSYAEPVSFAGTRVDFTVDDVIAANGVRMPAFGEAPTHFRIAFVLACANVDSCSAEDLATVEAQRTALPQAFSLATGGRATVDVDL